MPRSSNLVTCETVLSIRGEISCRGGHLACSPEFADEQGRRGALALGSVRRNRLAARGARRRGERRELVRSRDRHLRGRGRSAREGGAPGGASRGRGHRHERASAHGPWRAQARERRAAQGLPPAGARLRSLRAQLHAAGERRRAERRGGDGRRRPHDPHPQGPLRRAAARRCPGACCRARRRRARGDAPLAPRAVRRALRRRARGARARRSRRGA